MKKQKKQSQERRPGFAPSQNSAVFSYHNSRSRDSQNVGRFEQLEVTSRPSWWRLLPSYVALIAIIACGLYSLSIDIHPRVQVVEKDPQSILKSSKVYEDGFAKLLSESIFSKSKITINTKVLEEKMLTKYPELSVASITIPLMARRPVMAVAANDPALVLRTLRNEIVLDKEGRSVVEASSLSEPIRAKLPILEDKTDFDTPLGSHVLPKGTIAFIRSVQSQLTQQQKTIVTMTLPAVANELHVVTGEGAYYVKFDIQSDARTQVGTLLAAQKYLRENNVTPAEYIDVRVSEKAFYK